MNDDIEYNPFFKALQTTFEAIYIKAQADCCTICIPQTSSLPRSRNFDSKFVELHVLRPSPYFKGRYVTKRKGKDVEFEIEDGRIHAISGFSGSFKSAILSEELGYNKSYEQFKILLIDRTLDPDLQSCNHADEGSPTVWKLEQPKSAECIQLLKSHASLQKVVHNLWKMITTFNRSYVIVEGYLDQAASKLESFCLQAVQEARAALQSNHSTIDKRGETMIQVAIESLLMGGVHDKMFHFVKNAHRKLDEDLLARCRRFHGITAKDLSVAEHLCRPTPEAVVELASLDGHTNPLDKVICMKQCLELISEAAKTGADVLLGSEGIPSLASDDLIPLLVVVIIQAKCNYLPSNLYYVENFHWSTSSKADLGYTLVTFQAAVQFILKTDLSPLIMEQTEEEVSLQENSVSLGVEPQGPVQQESKKKKETSTQKGAAKAENTGTYSALEQLPASIKVLPYKGQPNVISRTPPPAQGLGGIVGRLQGRRWEERASVKLNYPRKRIADL
ncbi:ankyrin repeat domain-containing protein 27-like isoform X2 [Oscarella lobularis]|uniref:ankyrin repeat domain-containing protein 27-like isoform X2 n=1 Tax=Oscarella lobularis TaxID=121494 RepID=UPI003313BC1A